MLEDLGVLVLICVAGGIAYLVEHPIVFHSILHWTIGIAAIAVGGFILVWMNGRKKDKARREVNAQIRLDQDRKQQEELRDWEIRQLHDDMELAINERIEDIERITSNNDKGIAFERRMAAHFRLAGAKVQTTPRTGDGSADLILTYPDGLREVIQCKCWQYSVSPRVVAEVLKAKQLTEADQAVIITTSYLTKQAKEEAKVLGIEYWERARLLREIDQMRSRVQANKAAAAARPMSVNIRAVE